MNSSQLLKTLSFGARLLSVVITGVLWHISYKYIYKKINNDSEDESRNNDDYSDCYKTIRIKIPSYSKGGIIGKNGSTIRRIQEKTKTTIKFLNKTVSTIETSEDKQSDWNFDIADDEDQNSFDVILIRGLTLRVMEAEKEIKNVIASIPIYNEEQMVVDNRFIGKIIGKKGENIKRLKECYKVQIDIDKSDAPQRTIIIRGVAENIYECRRDIVKVIDIMIKEGKLYPLPNEDLSRYKVSTEVMNHNNMIRKDKDLLNGQYIKYPGGLNEKVQIYVSSVVDCNKFYAHIVSDDLKALTLLIDEMTDFFGKQSCNKVKSFNVGDVLAGYYEASHTWQRVKIISMKDTLFEVLFLDYGDSAFLNATELQTFEMCNHFLDLPFQALRLVTYGIKSANNMWSDSDIKYFESLTKVGDCYQLTAILKSKRVLNFEVQLFDEFNTDIIQTLINEGIAISNV